MRVPELTASACLTGLSTIPEFSQWPAFSSDDISAVSQVLASGKVNYWTGTQCTQFESEYAAQLGVRHAVAVANGTVALELALQCLNVGIGDEVIVTPRSFIASASCVVMRGAVPVFADVDRDSQNLLAETIAPLITSRTRAIIAVHLAGWPCEMDSILLVAGQHNIAVIEDCAQAHGATYKGTAVGSMGRINAFSFCQDKIMTTAGEGGLVATDDHQLWENAWSYKDHGKSYEAVYNRRHAPGFRWLHESFGTNWRMLEIQGAVGRQGLMKLESWVGLRRRNAAVLAQSLSCLGGLRIPEPPDHIFHSYYKFYVFLRPEALKSNWTRDRVIHEISSLGVPCFSGSCSEMYLERAFVDRGLGPSGRLPVAKELGETSLMFLVHPTLSLDAVNYTAEIVKRVVSQATR